MIKSNTSTIKGNKQKNSILGSAYKSGDGREPDTKIAALWRGGASYLEQDYTLIKSMLFQCNQVYH